MKNTLGMFVMLLPLAFLTIYANDLNAGQEEQETEKPWHCKGQCRTWIVIESEGTHMRQGDKFQIYKSGSEIKFTALSDLKGRWKKPLLTPFELNLTRTGPPAKHTEKTRLCGFLDVDQHPNETKDMNHGKEHMFKIKLKGNNMLQITWSSQSPDPEKTQVENCEAMDESHGGIVHAEPN